MNDAFQSPKLKVGPLDRAAIVYVRQSTPQQGIDHQESTARQYALADRAVELGWPRGQGTVIDDDRGPSGPSVEGRPGFQRLLAAVARDHVGLILGRETSRRARSGRDWHQLLERWARFRTLLADADGLDDPTDHNDRLLLGRPGMMSEAELPILKERLSQGKLNKARRGELMGMPPIGFVRLPSGEWAIDPDEQVQATVRLLFDQFDRETTLAGLLRYLVDPKVLIAVRPPSGANRGELEWRRPNRATLPNLLHPPSYAGASRFGHRSVDPRRKRPGRPNTGKLIRRPEDGLVLIRGPPPRVHHVGPLPGESGPPRSQPGVVRQPGGAAAGPVAAGRAGPVRAVRAADDRAGLGDERSPLLQRHPRLGRLRRAAVPVPVRPGGRWPGS